MHCIVSCTLLIIPFLPVLVLAEDADFTLKTCMSWLALGLKRLLLERRGMAYVA